ncbi:2-dehydro-3-deoxyphosphogluconate aldolase/(4S)-4-hydroxy-2-oxoglutarate aldolase [Rhodovulum bhavnagarense]|uniref:2-dehydro-3-deoxy-phosphogluconate aldolase n=1 Tax=Rhodovulum bhavnagarense TaxID=992286 RepID=A0A4R2RKJ1_9RHOB|nr:bifunctional 4-hydroxy-2-oxoglutarate aldolase/2-dehydro-3-deoxy-phosphogluconate aldolase [Rhodovulum bhavnagarense]TCP63328.1 2-dehydro-3-deoxyphosphogluconate aldolase/(4S)-4-hydroxy-2-oxoglutarate aldolase [Rhodovulum bhavnagarense]
MTGDTANQELENLLGLAPVIPVLVVDQAEIARPLAEALVSGGLPVLEVTLRTPAAFEAIAAMAGVPGAVVGAGTLLNPHDIAAAQAAGARFGVSPGATPSLLKATREAEFPLLPGMATASEAMTLMEMGHRVLKFFPATAAGGVDMLKALAGPLPGLRFCPTGGIGHDTARDYLAQPNVLCVGGSWLAPRDRIAARDWDAIRTLAEEAARLAR